ncbi:hypothetical protein PILCRDRAFT_830140 [Piloderma croceum F 1598]|uniref:Uncharacterized protein n=1 Tax=Piloderma croceum (strain F 1598) TaxID=765440 RepID=A0A0C3EUR2_PILCF|nr:hypothetical protein PILCRDRAFT_830140 [Piloderma croceum F 1598]
MAPTLASSNKQTSSSSVAPGHQPSLFHNRNPTKFYPIINRGFKVVEIICSSPLQKQSLPSVSSPPFPSPARLPDFSNPGSPEMSCRRELSRDPRRSRPSRTRPPTPPPPRWVIQGNRVDDAARDGGARIWRGTLRTGDEMAVEILQS